MLGTNLLGNVAIVHGDNAEASGQDAAFQNGVSVDMQTQGAKKIVGVVHVGTVAGGTAAIAVKLEHSDTNTGVYTDISNTEVSVTPGANKFVAVEADTRSVIMKRFVRLSYNRSTADSQVLGVFYVLANLRKTGDITNGDITGAKIGSEA